MPGETEITRSDLILISAARLARIESMMIFLMETTPAEQTVRPTLDQAKDLAAMGRPAWPTMKRDTNKYTIWRESWDKLQAAVGPGPAGDLTNGETDDRQA